MKTKSLNTLITLFAIVTVCSICAQTEKKPLTNTDVIQMVKAGLTEAVLIGAISGSPANYDTSPAALIELNNQGVGAKVQEAMLAAQQGPPPPVATAAPPPSPTQATGAPASTMPNTVVYLDGTNRLELKQSLGKMDTSYRVVYVDAKTVFAGATAQFRVTTSSPVFEVALLSNFDPADWIILIKPKIKKDQREIFLGGAAPFAQIKPNKKKDTVPLTHEEARKENTPGMQLAIHRVKPAAPLPAGEYVLSVQGAYYCFGVDAVK